MPTKKEMKMQDKTIWNRLGFELAVLRELLGEIRVDKDYFDILPSKIFDNLAYSIDRVDRMRSKAEDHMFKYTPFHDLHIFYPYTGKRKIIETAEAIRQMIEEAANEEP